MKAVGSLRQQAAYLYAIRQVGTNYVKIGVSVDPHSRLQTLQTGCPEKLILEKSLWCGLFSPSAANEKSVTKNASAASAPGCAYFRESHLHGLLRRQGFHKRLEWFEISTADLTEYFKALAYMQKCWVASSRKRICSYREK
jgi:hypothetical protein